MPYFIQKYKQLFVFGLIILVGVILLLSKGMPEKHIRVVVTIAPLKMLTYPIIAGLGDVDVLVPEEGDPKTYVMTEKDKERVRGADIFLSWGMGVDTFAEKFIDEEPFLKPNYVVIGDAAYAQLKKQKKALPESPFFFWNPHFVPVVSRVIRDSLIPWDLKASGFIQVHEQKLKMKYKEIADEFDRKKDMHKESVIIVQNQESASFLQDMGYLPLLLKKGDEKQQLEKLLQKFHQVHMLTLPHITMSDDDKQLDILGENNVRILSLPIFQIQEKKTYEENFIGLELLLEESILK